MSTTLRGVFAESLGGFLVVRGFAKLSELAKHSFADSYQRGIKPDHQAAIQKFYERGEYHCVSKYNHPPPLCFCPKKPRPLFLRLSTNSI